MRTLTAYLTAGLLLLTSGLAFAHSEHDKARFVSPDGKDIGNCDNVLRPCKTIGYAALRANKGDKVLVAGGSYKIENTEELFYLQSNLVPIKGGFNKFDHYQNQSPDINVSTLVGVPPEFATELEQRGFNVITDAKALAKDPALAEKLAAYSHLSQAQQNTPCNNGFAGGFSCNNVNLLSHMPLSSFSIDAKAGSDIWGHVDLNTGKEYAIIGLDSGTSVVDVSNPSNPVEVGAIAGHNVIWRDIKVYQFFDPELNLWQSYAYVTLDGSNATSTDNVTIIDLNNLPHSISLVEKNTTVYKAHNIYISNVDHTLNIANSDAAPLLHLIGTDRKSGQYQNYALSNPRTITKLTDNYSNSLSTGSRPYTHDGASMMITDQRKDSDCVNADTFCSVFIDFNETEMLLWDITNSSQVTSLGKGTYSNPQYVHSGWSTEDNQYVFVHDELDEARLGLNTTLRVFDVNNLRQPTLTGTWTGPTNAIDHNGFVRGNRYYMSNYERGLTILDITDPVDPEQVGFFDTFTVSNNASFNGAWGVYPFLPSGNILVSDINSGLYILEDNTLASEQGTIYFNSSDLDVLPGEKVNVPIRRSNASNDATSVSVNYELLSGSALSGVDYESTSGELTWDENINGIQSININVEQLNEDGKAKTFFVRLFDPQNGATLSSPSYLTIKIDGNAENSSVSFIQETIKTSENQETFEIAAARNGNTNKDISVNYTLIAETALSGEDFIAQSGSISWLTGDNENKTITVQLINDETKEPIESLSIVFSEPNNTQIGAIGEMTVTIADDDSNEAPAVILNENFQANTGQSVTLTAQATDPENDEMTYLWEQTSGVSVNLSNSDSLSASFTAPGSAGELTFKFTATDFRGASSSSEITVTLVAAPEPTPTPTKSKSSGGGGSTYWLTYCCLLVLSMRYISLGRK
ncbi:hypothetical protein tinsulaeT_10500 [Thalassotalea insulae]|uniref:Calx-beta domain-containing protein n=1 Tax=Thalassotalea insulae TaxID=2056778 RepID=A0ABQ6GTD0_9GAMM|nr:choice-of-anchor B family protein [Thalassotalea insulae]GLX77710.1 hypothetical protein tinsulaeT_10500 [Thalassotalea insulae]